MSTGPGPLTQEQVESLRLAYCELENDSGMDAIEITIQRAARLGMELAAQVCQAGMDGTSMTYADACFHCAALIRERARK